MVRRVRVSDPCIQSTGAGVTVSVSVSFSVSSRVLHVLQGLVHAPKKTSMAMTGEIMRQ